MSESPACPNCVLLLAQVARLEERIQQLEARLGQNSSNSSRPPSADPPAAPPAVKKGRSKRRRGGQPGHKPHPRQRLPQSRVDHTVRLVPDRCGGCGHALPAEPRPGDPEPTWHQVFELPRAACVVTEFQGHARACPCCGHVTHHPIPDAIRRDAFGPRLAAALSALAGCQHVSARGLREVAEAVLGVPVALGSLARLQRQLGEALAAPARALADLVKHAPVKHVDETGWKRAGKRCWLWAALAGGASYFLVHARRSKEALHALLGGEPRGVVVSDRWSAYQGIPLARRQVCWAHLIRDFQAMAEAGGKAAEVGDGLLTLTGLLFAFWRKVRDGTRKRPWLVRMLEEHVRPEVQEYLEEGTSCGHAPTQGTCAKILEVEEALWTFARVEGVEPTNNAAERAIRPAVLRRKKSFGSDSEAGCEWFGRLLSVTQTLKRGGLAVLDYLTEALRAFRHGLVVPPLPNPG
jgi:transposase